MARDGWTAVASLLRSEEAEVLRGLLESAGIEALVEDGAISALNPLLQSAVGGAKVLVPVADEARAASIVSGSGLFSGTAAEPEEIPEEEWAASGPPDAAARRLAGSGATPGDERDDGGERSAGHAFRSSFVALALAATLVVPLYAISAAVRALRAPGPRTPRARRRSGWALLVSALALALGLVLWASVFPGLRLDEPARQEQLPPPPRGHPARP